MTLIDVYATVRVLSVDRRNKGIYALKKIYLIFRDFSKQMIGDNISAYASSTAFFFFLSVVPILLIVSTVITFTPLDKDALLDTITTALPTALSGTAARFIEQVYDKATTILPIAIVVAIWSAGKGMMALQMGLNVAHGVREDRNFVIIRLQASFYMIITLAALLLTFSVSMIGKTLISYVSRFAPHLLDITHFFVRYRFIFGWAALTIIFTLIYTFIPNMKLKARYQIPGAALAAVGWQLLALGFSIYVDYFDGMSVYGSLSTIVISMMWLYMSMYILLIGANLNRYFKPLIRVFYKKGREIVDERKTGTDS